jgi:DNA-binding MarR family transcriptional regulator
VAGLSEDEKALFAQLQERVGRLLEILEKKTDLEQQVNPPFGSVSAFLFGNSQTAVTRSQNEPVQNFGRTIKPPLPDPRLIRRIIRQRQLRARYFDSDLFGDPAWDMLLDLTAARAEHTRVSVTSLCIASGVPPTTALRWIGQMTEMGLFDRIEDEADRRRAFVALSDKAADLMARYFAELGTAAVPMA